MNIVSKYGLTAFLVILLLIIAYSLINFDHQADNAFKEQPGEQTQQKKDEIAEDEETGQKNDYEQEDMISKPVAKGIYGSWIIDRSVDELTDKKSVSAILESENITKAWLDTTRPAFIIRCIDGETDVLLNTRHQFKVDSGHSGEVHITYIIDDEPPETQYWERGPDGKTALSNEPLSLVKKLSKAEVLRIEFTPFNAEKVGAVFDLTGYKNVAREVADACDWEI